jgi:phosphopantetheinyl transferase
LSFSHGNGRLWAAMSGRGSVGIDVAYPEEFRGAYPFGRAFSAEEMACAGALCPGDTARGAALMWAVKEAAVKATGAGFNFFDPLEVRVGPPLYKEQCVLFEVTADRPISTWVRTEGKGWLSVALA